MRVCASRWNVPTPPGSLISFAKGERVLLKSKTGRNPDVVVEMIDGELKSHTAHPDGYVYEVRLPPEHGSDVIAVDADQIHPIFDEERA